ncbi:hypothetical protein QZH41_006470 [Actinostola sp. cb2023]|nr:hypothetical protein QZH41_006470 [Actinostola sp. cb2023]
MLFPAELEYLDVRYSHGHKTIYQAMTRHLDNLKWLGMCDALFLAMSKEQPLRQNTTSRHLEKLDMSHCRLVKDAFIAMFSSCKNLKLLNLRKCFNIYGESLPGLVASLTCLETLILDGTSVDDKCLQLVDWRNTKIKYLEVGWCPLITTEGLQYALPKIAQISSLEYLGLCRIGQGQALTDYNLEQLAIQLQRDTCPRLQSLNLSFSDKITDEGLANFENLYHIEALDVITSLEEEDEVVLSVDKSKQSIGVFEDAANGTSTPGEHRGKTSAHALVFEVPFQDGVWIIVDDFSGLLQKIARKRVNRI